MNVGELTLDTLPTDIDASEFDLIYVLSKEVPTFNMNGFSKMFSEEKVKFCKHLQQIEPPSSSICSVFDCSYNREDLYQLAYESGKQSRFYWTQNLPKQNLKNCIDCGLIIHYQNNLQTIF